MNEALVLCELVAGAVEVGRGAVSLNQHPVLTTPPSRAQASGRKKDQI